MTTAVWPVRVISVTPGGSWSRVALGDVERQPAPAVEEHFFVVRVDDPAAIDERDLVGDLLDVERVVRREQDRAFVVLEDLHELRERLVPRDGVEARRRLVEDQQSRPAREHEQERRLGALAVRQAFHVLLGA